MSRTGCLADADPDGSIDPGEQRQRAIDGLCVALAGMASRRPLVLVLDDAHLADAGALQLLVCLVEAAIPALLVVVSMRSTNDGRRINSLEGLRAARGRFVDDIELGPLDDRAMHELLEACSTSDDEVARRNTVVREAAGVPLVALELSADGGATRSIDESVHARLANLSDDERRLVDIVVLAHSVSRPVLRSSIRPAELDVDRTIDRLESARVITASGVGPRERIRPWHVSIGDAIVRRMPDETRRAIHRAIASAIARVEPDAEASIAFHLDAAGDGYAAVPHAIAAADAFDRMLEFDRAVELRRLAIRTGILDTRERVRQEVAVADALVAGGRGFEAAATFSAIAGTTTNPSERTSLAHRELEQLFLSGHVASGVDRLVSLGRTIGITWPGTPAVAAFRALVIVCRLAWSGLDGGRRSDPESVTRADVSFAAARGLLPVDSVRGAYFAFAALEQALRSGESSRMSSTLLAVGGGVLGALDGPLGRWGRAMIERAHALAIRTDDDRNIGFADVARSQAAIYRGDWEAALSCGERGVERLLARCVGVAWEVNLGYMGVIRALDELGQIDVARARTLELVRGASRRSDRYAEITAELYGAFHDLHAGDPDGAVDRARGALTRWPTESYSMQHFYLSRLEIHAHLHRGAIVDALAEMARLETDARKSGLGAVPVIGIDRDVTCGRVVLGELVRGGGRASRGRLRGIVRSLTKYSRPDARVHATAFRGALATIDGDSRAAHAAFVDARTRFDELGMTLASALVSARLADLLGHDPTESRARIESHGIGAIESWLDTMLPVARGVVSQTTLA